MLPHHFGRFFAVLVLAVLMVIVSGCSSDENGAATDGTNGKNGDQAQQVPEATVAAADLVAAFAKDSAAAGKEYGDKVLKVTGVVGTHVRTDAAGEKHIWFGEWDDILSDYKTILIVYPEPSELSKAEELWRGQEVTIIGKCVNPPVGDAFLSEARFDEVGDPIPVIEVAAGDLISEYEADAAAADEKYEGKVLVVTGVVTAKDDDEQTVDIRGSAEGGEDAMRLQIGYGLIEDALVAALKEINPGDQIKFKGECDGKSSSENRIDFMWVKIQSP